MVLAVATLVLASVVAPPAEIKGKWEGTLKATRNDGTTHEDSVLLILNQKESTITGTVGGNESDQHPITSGTIDGNKVVIVARHATDGREYRLELTLEKDELKGTVTSGERRGEVHTRKRKE